MAITKSDRIRSLLARIRPGSIAAPAVVDTVERFKDGTPKDRLIALREKLDGERFTDPSYYRANRDEILELRRLEQERGTQEADAQFQAERRAAHEKSIDARNSAFAAEKARREAEECARMETATNHWVKPEDR